MPINPIAMQVKPANTSGMLNTLAAIRQMQTAGQQQQMNQLAIEKAQQERAEAQAFKNALSQFDYSTPEGMASIMQASPTMGLGLQKNLLSMSASQSAADLNKQKLFDARNKSFKELAANIQNPDQAKSFLQGMYSDPVVGPSLKAVQPLDQVLQSIPTDEQGFSRFVGVLSNGPAWMLQEAKARQQQKLQNERISAEDQRAALSRASAEERARLGREQSQKQFEATTDLKQRALTLNERKQQWQEKYESPEMQRSLASARAIGKEMSTNAVKREAALPGVIQQAEVGLNAIDQMIGDAAIDSKGNIIIQPKKDEKGNVIGEGRGLHPGFASAVGFGLGERFVPGTDAAGFNVLHDQITGQAFLKAYETLKGGGQITTIEGEKATAAINRMNLAQNEKEYLAAAREFQAILKRGIEKAKSEMKSGVPGARLPVGAGDVDASHPLLK